MFLEKENQIFIIFQRNWRHGRYICDLDMSGRPMSKVTAPIGNTFL
jgi:hypothetical protein